MTLGPDAYYLEERDVPPPTNRGPPPPGSGFLLGNGTWLYRETHVLPGLQRGSACWGTGPHCCLPPVLVCVLIVMEPVEDENCGHGRDEQIYP